MGRLAGRTVPNRLRQEPSRLRPAEPIPGAASPRRSKSWTNTARWKRERLAFLNSKGWMCEGCPKPHLLCEGRTHPDSAVVDHIIAHRGNPVLFWDQSNWQSVCKAYHDRVKQAMERSGG